MSEPADAPPPPSLLAHVVAYVLIGILVWALTKKVFRQRPVVAMIAGFIAAAAHYRFDTPVARRLSKLGI